MSWYTELHPDGVAQRGEVVQMVRLATHAMDFDGAVWHDEQAVRVVRAAVLGDHRRGPGMRRLQLLGNDVRTRDALSRISDELRGPDVHGRADVDEAPVLRFVQGYGMLRRPNPERHLTRSFRVDVTFLCFRVVVHVNLQFCAANVNSAVLDIEYRADLCRERPAVAFPCTRQSEAFRRYWPGKPNGTPYGPRAGYGMLNAYRER